MSKIRIKSLRTKSQYLHEQKIMKIGHFFLKQTMHERKLQLLFHIRDHVYIQETMLLNAKQNGEK